MNDIPYGFRITSFKEFNLDKGIIEGIDLLASMNQHQFSK
jgi:hypothetical protein